LFFYEEAKDFLMFRPLPFTVIVPTVYGLMLVNRHDINQTNALFKTGAAIDHDEITMLAHLLRKCNPNPVFVDVGANVGTYSIALASIVGPLGKVHSFEPQRIIYNMLAGSVALNSLTNVYCYNAALGDHEGTIELPQFDYSRPLNFGSIEFGPVQREQLEQVRAHDPTRVEFAPLTTLDHLGWERVDLIKIDVEGMEIEVISGARTTIQRCRPILYVEFLKNDRSALRELIAGLGYVLFNVGVNVLSIPSESSGLLTAAREVLAPR